MDDPWVLQRRRLWPGGIRLTYLTTSGGWGPLLGRERPQAFVAPGVRDEENTGYIRLSEAHQGGLGFAGRVDA